MNGGILIPQLSLGHHTRHCNIIGHYCQFTVMKVQAKRFHELALNVKNTAGRRYFHGNTPFKKITEVTRLLVLFGDWLTGRS